MQRTWCVRCWHMTGAMSLCRTVNGVSLSEELVPWMPFGDEEMNALVRPDWDTINKRRDELIQRWNQEIIPIVSMG